MKLAKAILSRIGIARGDAPDAVELRFAQLSLAAPRPCRRRSVSPFAVIVRAA